MVYLHWIEKSVKYVFGQSRHSAFHQYECEKTVKLACYYGSCASDSLSHLPHVEPHRNGYHNKHKVQAYVELYSSSSSTCVGNSSISSSSKVESGTEYKRSSDLFGSLTSTYLPSSMRRTMSTIVRTIPQPLLRLSAIWEANSRGLLVRTPRTTWSLLFLGLVRETKLSCC